MWAKIKPVQTGLLKNAERGNRTPHAILGGGQPPPNAYSSKIDNAVLPPARGKFFPAPLFGVGGKIKPVQTGS
ncbi:MAG: hypothetical protein COV73_04205 [Candidatus Omnitrophica bacterium CG11_big_fil_rev_8_21_14_0_20_43_6]|nr:MAG: hypothetical protein COV73_04205 [Candidatus Omnitrophica bacterium CG11_big_fil_rev_8_21_14_0_20_43_6]